MYLSDQIWQQANLPGGPRAGEGGNSMVKTAVTLSGVLLDNPVIPASGTFGFGYEFAQWYDINCLGAISIKGTTREPRFGNRPPGSRRPAGGMLNAVGLQNPGIDRVVAEELPSCGRSIKSRFWPTSVGFLWMST